jgi:hypothetical protein
MGQSARLRHDQRMGDDLKKEDFKIFLKEEKKEDFKIFLKEEKKEDLIKIKKEVVNNKIFWGGFALCVV